MRLVLTAMMVALHRGCLRMHLVVPGPRGLHLTQWSALLQPEESNRCWLWSKEVPEGSQKYLFEVPWTHTGSGQWTTTPQNRGFTYVPNASKHTDHSQALHTTRILANWSKPNSAWSSKYQPHTAPMHQRSEDNNWLPQTPSTPTIASLCNGQKPRDMCGAPCAFCRGHAAGRSAKGRGQGRKTRVK